jgi:hypothetical protein
MCRRSATTVVIVDQDGRGMQIGTPFLVLPHVSVLQRPRLNDLNVRPRDRRHGTNRSVDRDRT